MTMVNLNKNPVIPEFAVVGHPNEGKSSVVSTLTEDDQIRVSPVPGETTRASSYTVKIDQNEIVRFIDTPGFQVPQQALAWFQAYKGEPNRIVQAFIEQFKDDPFYADECELFEPVAHGAGIIYVVDGSRPVRDDDLAEIEILRLTGRPRMAVINSKTKEKDYTRDWKDEFAKSFNAIRVFNSNTANFNERISMLESLKPIDQGWEAALSKVIQAFKSDWEKRKTIVSADIFQTIESCLYFSVSEPLNPDSHRQKVEKKLIQKYQTRIKSLEQQLFQNIRAQFKHHLFDHPLPEYAILEHDLFSEQTWELLGLTTRQLAGAGAVLGGSLGVVLDTAAAGISFGVFTAIGSMIGAGSAVLGGKKIAGKNPGGLRLGGDKVTIGPNKNPQFIFILLDRILIYTAQMMNRAHGKRDVSISDNALEKTKRGYTTRFSMDEKKICAQFLKTCTRKWKTSDKKTGSEFQNLIEQKMDELSGASG